MVPARTYSSTRERHASTFTYTNSVPQKQAFNVGQWAQFEGRIRRYAEQTCTPQPANLFLLTGTAFSRIQGNNPPQIDVNVQVDWLDYPENAEAKIAIPNSLWTAGCCVRPNGLAQSFAVIGNNVENTNEMLTQEVTVA